MLYNAFKLTRSTLKFYCFIRVVLKLLFSIIFKPLNPRLFNNAQALKTHNPENWIICRAFKRSSCSATAVKALWKFQRPLYSPLNRCFIRLNLRHTHQSTMVKLLRKQDWEDLLYASFHMEANTKKPYLYYTVDQEFSLVIILSTQKQPNCKKKVRPMQKKQHEKSYEIKGGGPEVTVVVW